MRRDRELKLAQIGVGNSVEIQVREGRRSIALHVPGVVAAQNGRNVLLGHGRPTEKGISALPASVIFPRPFGLVVDRTGVVGDFVTRPVFRESIGLADSRGPAAGGVSDRL